MQEKPLQFVEMDFGEWLKEKREQAELTQGGLSDRTDRRVSVSTISSVELGTRKASAQTVDRLARALGADKDEARLAAGYAPLSLIPGKPQSLSDLLASLERIGIEGIQFFDQDALARSTPDELAEVLKAVELAVQITLRRQQLPFNDRPTPDTDRSGRRE